MAIYILKRLLSGVGVLVTVIILICSIIYLAPVDPTRLTFGQRSNNETVLQKQKELGLDQSLPVQMAMYLRDISPIVIVQHESTSSLRHVGIEVPIGSYDFVIKAPYLRASYQSGRPVATLLKETIPKTIILALAAFIFATFIGIILGVIAALKKGSVWDHVVLTVSTLGISVPSYVSAIVFAIVFGYLFSSITGLNMQGSIFEINDIGDDIIVWKNLLLPALALGVRPVSIIVQLSRSAMLDVLNQNYIKTAKSKGLGFKNIVVKHALRNAMNPIITSLSGWLASLLAGAFFIEKVFNYKGVGELTINALINYDIPVILACVLFIASVFVIINILTDIFYALFDPKVQV